MQGLLSDTSPLNKIIEKKLEIDKMIRETGEEAFSDFFKDVFTTLPFIKEIEWRQYTPYFNDGDACVFSLHGVEVLIDTNLLPINDTSDVYSDYHDGDDIDANCIWLSLWNMPPLSIEDHPNQKWVEHMTERINKANALYGVQNRVALTELDQVINGSKELLLYAFGDHVHVRVTPEEITVESYDHD